MTIRKSYITIAVLSLALLASIRTCTQVSREANSNSTRMTNNLKAMQDTIIGQREAYGKVYSENFVLRLTSDELIASNIRLSDSLKSVVGRLKRVQSRTKVVVDRQEVIVPIEVCDSTDINYEDEAITIRVANDSLAYKIKPIVVDIIQYRKGNEVIAAVNASNGFEVKGISSFVIEEEKKKRFPWFPTGVGVGVLITLLLL